MDYSPKPGFTPRIKPPTPTTPATSKFQPVSNTITTTTISVATTDFSTSSPKCHQWEVISMLISPAYSQTNNTNNPTPLATATTTTILVQNINEHFLINLLNVK